MSSLQNIKLIVQVFLNEEIGLFDFISWKNSCILSDYSNEKEQQIDTVCA